MMANFGLQMMLKAALGASPINPESSFSQDIPWLYPNGITQLLSAVEEQEILPALLYSAEQPNQKTLSCLQA